MNVLRSQNSTSPGPECVLLSQSPMLPRRQKPQTRNWGSEEATGQASITVQSFYRESGYSAHPICLTTDKAEVRELKSHL